MIEADRVLASGGAEKEDLERLTQLPPGLANEGGTSASDPTEYPWLAGGPDQPFPSESLRASDVPPPLTGSRDAEAVKVVNQFAHTFNGYDWAGSLKELAARYQRVHRAWLGGDILPDDVDELRSFLIFWFRRTGTAGGTARARKTSCGSPRCSTRYAEGFPPKP